MENNNVIVLDTTLRDGEQTPGVSFSINEKIEIARQLNDIGVNVIEAGFPAASNADFKAVESISRAVKKATVCSLARCRTEDIDTALEAMKDAVKARLHIFIATSPTHRKYKLNMSKEKILDKIAQSVAYASKLCDEIQFSCEDATRTELDFLLECYKTAYKNGATIINIPDTVGYACVDEYASLIKKVNDYLNSIKENNDPNFYISVHTHNDLGLATATTLAGLKAGARQFECTVNGLGERAGNAPFEEVILGLRTRKDIYKLDDSLDLRKLYKLSRLVAEHSGFEPAQNKAVVGSAVYSHQSGIHQHGVLKNRTTYEIINPKDLGIPSGDILLSKLSGRHAFLSYAEQLGYTLTERELDEVFAEFKDFADQKKTVSEKDVLALLTSASLKSKGKYKMISHQVFSGDKLISTSTISLAVEDHILTNASCGEGPIDACFSTINLLTGIPAKLQSFELKAVSEGRDGLGEATVKVEYEGTVMIGKGVSTDIIEGSCYAYINAINRIIASKEKEN
ncbi:MAG: 2-isopropylmalate synthase [Christensenellaceae bacterium]|nr:2-isopropylmalate synthase [Christensenellaceae bacterium]